MARSPAPLALLLLAPLVAGCTWFDPPDGPVPGVHPALVHEVWVVPGLDLRLDTPFGNVRAQGEALAVPLRFGGQEVGAVYLSPEASYRADAIFQVREKAGLQGPLFVQAPLGEWQGVRASQAWRAAGPQDLAPRGFEGQDAALLAASRPMPANLTAPLAQAWVLNGTVSARIQPTNFSVAVEEGPFVFQRDANGFVAIQNRTVIRWTQANQSIAVASGALANAEARDPAIAEVQARWDDANRVEVRLLTPPFRAADLKVDEDRVSNIIAVAQGDIAQVAMVRYEGRDIRDNFVEVRSQNITLRMGPP